MSKVIAGTGRDLPEWVLTNEDLVKAASPGDRTGAEGKSRNEWLARRIGITERHRIRPGEGTSDMGARAARRALEDAGLEVGGIGLIVVSTFTSDYRTPNTSALIQKQLGSNAPFFQLDSACVGFVQATITAAALMDSMEVEHALVVAAEAPSVYADPDNFLMQCLIGDGAGAAVLRNEPGSPYGIRAQHIAGTGEGAEFIMVPGGGPKEPITHELVTSGRQFVHWDQKAIHSFAVEKVVESTRLVAERAGWTLAEVSCFVPHQAGIKILTEAADRLGQPLEKWVINMEHTGNTSGATMPIALDEASRDGRFHDGDKLLMPAMGAGLQWGALAVVWQAHGRDDERSSKDAAPDIA